MKFKITVFELVDVNVPPGHNITFYKSQLFIKYYLISENPDELPYIFYPSNITVEHLPFLFKQYIIIYKNNISEFFPPALIGI